MDLNNNNWPNGHLFYVGGDLLMRRGMLPIIMLPDGDLRIVLHLVPFWILTIWGGVHIENFTTNSFRTPKFNGISGTFVAFRKKIKPTPYNFAQLDNFKHPILEYTFGWLTDDCVVWPISSMNTHYYFMDFIVITFISGTHGAPLLTWINLNLSTEK